MIGETSYLELQSYSKNLGLLDINFPEQAILIQKIFDIFVLKLNKISIRWLILVTTLEKIKFNKDKIVSYINNFITESKEQIRNIKTEFNIRFFEESKKFRTKVKNYKKFLIDNGAKINDIPSSVTQYIDFKKLDTFQDLFKKNIIKANLIILEAQRFLNTLDCQQVENSLINKVVKSKITHSTNDKNNDKEIQIQLSREFDQHRKQLKEDHKKE